VLVGLTLRVRQTSIFASNQHVHLASLFLRRLVRDVGLLSREGHRFGPLGEDEPARWRTGEDLRCVGVSTTRVSAWTQHGAIRTTRSYLSAPSSSRRLQRLRAGR
jgi:hypothetical protein